MQALVKENLEKIERILEAHKVKRAYLFGSAATARFSPESDVDFLVTFGKIPFGEYATNYWSLEDDLQQLLNRKVDVVVERTLTNPYLIKVINQTKTLIYE
jgi:uncharacterized protein